MSASNPPGSTPALDALERLRVAAREGSDYGNPDRVYGRGRYSEDDDADLIRSALQERATQAEPERWYATAEMQIRDGARELILTSIPFDDHDEPVTLYRSPLASTQGETK